jgi:hypothetical protein
MDMDMGSILVGGSRWLICFALFSQSLGGFDA